jgi:pilus assembly protein CpaF
MAGLDLPSRAIREQVSSALHLIVQLQRFRDGSRRIIQVTEVGLMEGEVITLSDLFSFDYSTGRVQPTGIRPSFSEHLSALGCTLPAELFGETDLFVAGRR